MWPKAVDPPEQSVDPVIIERHAAPITVAVRAQGGEPLHGSGGVAKRVVALAVPNRLETALVEVSQLDRTRTGAHAAVRADARVVPTDVTRLLLPNLFSQLEFPHHLRRVMTESRMLRSPPQSEQLLAEKPEIARAQGRVFKLAGSIGIKHHPVAAAVAGQGDGPVQVPVIAPRDGLLE